MAYEVRELDLPLPNQFFQQESRASRLMVVLPGSGYSCDMPLLYYAMSLAVDRGWDGLQIRYNFKAAGDDLHERMRTDVVGSLRRLLSKHSYDEIFLVGKSLGTYAMTLVLESDVSHGNSFKPVWLTPTLRREEVMPGMIKNPGLVVIGTADTHYLPKKLELLKGSQIYVVPEADHSMEIPRDTVRSLDNLVAVTKKIAEFLG